MKNPLIPLLILALALPGCTAPAPANPTAPTAAPGETAAPRDWTGMLNPGYTDRDLDASWKDAVSITLADGAIAADGPGVEIDGDTVTIAKEGAYLLSGSLSAGQVRVILPGDNDKAQLVLNGVDVTCPDGPALHVLEADKVFVTLAPESENFLTDGAEYALELNEDEPNAALFSKEDLTINGSGSLTVRAHYRHGVLSKDSLVIAGGNITVEAVEDAVRGRDSVAIRDARLTLTAGSDGIQSNNDEDASRGWISIDGGTLSITAGNDGVQAETALQVTAGTVDIATGGGSATVTQEESWQRPHMPDMFGGGRGGGPRGGQMPEGGAEIPEGGTPPEGMPEMPKGGTPPEGMPEMPEGGTPPEGMPEMPEGGTPPEMPGGMTPPGGMPQMPQGSGSQAGIVEEDTPSAKGLKAGTLLHINGGTITLDCADDALHSDGDVILSGGVITASTGDDGAHANNTLSLTGGALTVAVSREGLEGAYVAISGGEIDVTARDDGINAAGGSDEAESETGTAAPFEPDRFGGMADGSSIDITGGTVLINAGGDGLDSNGNIAMSGGTLYVNGPVSEGEGPLDYGGQATISGGTAVIVGSGRMALGFHESSPQHALLVRFEETLPAESTLAVVDAGGTILLEFTSAKEFSSAVLSAPGMDAQASLYVNGELYDA